MAKTISNDAIWEKLSEIDEKLEKIVLDKQQENTAPVNIQPLSNDEILASIKENAFILGKSNDSHFEANRKNIGMLNHNILVVKKSVENIKIPESLNLDEIKVLFEKKDIFRFGFGKVKKASFIITVLGILIFVLTVFCMKLYSDSLINQNNYYRQVIVTRKLQVENDSLKVKATDKPIISKKKK